MNDDRLEKIIIKNKAELDYSFSGKDRSWAHIENALNPSLKKTHWTTKLSGIAAAIALGILSVWIYTQYNNQFMLSEEATASIAYYSQTENHLIKDVLQNTNKINADIQRDLDEINATQKVLMQGLAAAPNDKKDWILNTLIHTYELKIQLLNELLVSDNLEKSYTYDINKL